MTPEQRLRALWEVSGSLQCLHGTGHTSYADEKISHREIEWLTQSQKICDFFLNYCNRLQSSGKCTIFPPLGNVCRNITTLFQLSRGEITYHLYLMQLPILRVVSLLLLFVLLGDSCCEFWSPWNYCFFCSTWDKGQRATLIWKSIPQLEPGGSTPHPTPTREPSARLCQLSTAGVTLSCSAMCKQTGDVAG